MALCNAADHFFGGSYSKREDPHISLLYSDLDCDFIKSKAELTDTKIPQKAEIQEIAVVELNGDPNEWNILERIKFREHL